MNSERRRDYTDRDGGMFMPINVEGGTFNEHFITTPKLICIVTIVISLFVIITYLNSNHTGVLSYVLCIGIWLFVSIQVLRFIVFEEKFYYRMYKELKSLKEGTSIPDDVTDDITTPAIFWDIASIKDTPDGAIITYADARIGVIMKVERDTIIGKTDEFAETHYDAISDFYRQLVLLRYSWVQMNIMEQAGKDPRLSELSKLVYKSDNKSICKLMELQVGYIKNITRISLCESDYFLIYTKDLTKIDNIISDVSLAVSELLNGAYSAYGILSMKEIVNLVKEKYGVNYFNATEASLLMFNRNYANVPNPLNITGILWENGEEQELNSKETTKLRKITNSAIREAREGNDLNLHDNIYRKPEKIKVGVDFDELAKDAARTKKKTANNNKKAGKGLRVPGIKKQEKEKVVATDSTYNNDIVSEELFINANYNYNDTEVLNSNTDYNYNDTDSSNDNDDDDDYIDL